MHPFTSHFLLALSAIASCAAEPEVSHPQLPKRVETAQSVHLIFQSGSEYYNLMIPANGMTYYTGRIFWITQALPGFTKLRTLCGAPKRGSDRIRVGLLTSNQFTENPLHVSLIRSDNYDINQNCDFETVGDEEVALVSSLAQKTRDFWPIHEIAVGPPSPIFAVTCRGVCLLNYGKLSGLSTIPVDARVNDTIISRMSRSCCGRVCYTVLSWLLCCK